MSSENPLEKMIWRRAGMGSALAATGAGVPAAGPDPRSSRRLVTRRLRAGDLTPRSCSSPAGVLIALLVSAITGLVDGILSRTLSIFLRAPLTGLVGAVAAVWSAGRPAWTAAAGDVDVGSRSAAHLVWACARAVARIWPYEHLRAGIRRLLLRPPLHQRSRQASARANGRSHLQGENRTKGNARVSENPPENDADRGSLFTDLPWLRRTLVFGLLGPLLGVFELLASEAVLGGLGYLLSVIMGVVFVFGLLASIVTGIMDGRLSRILPVAWRAPLAALSGALLAVGPPAVLLGPMPLNRR